MTWNKWMWTGVNFDSGQAVTKKEMDLKMHKSLDGINQKPIDYMH